MLKESMNQYYEKMYANEINFNSLKNIKKLAPLKRIKKELVKKYCKGSNVLELGCGLGEYISMFGTNAYGSDIAFNALKKAKIFCPDSYFFQANAVNLPIKDGSFDCILLIDVLEHVENYENLLCELKRISKVGGRVIILTHYSNKYETVKHDEIKLWKNVVGEGGDLRKYGLNLIDRLKEKGFREIVVKFIGGPLVKKTNNIKMKILNKKGYNRKDILSGKVGEIRGISFYSKLLYLLYKLDYFIFGRKKGKFIFLVMDKK